MTDKKITILFSIASFLSAAIVASIIELQHQYFDETYANPKGQVIWMNDVNQSTGNPPVFISMGGAYMELGIIDAGQEDFERKGYIKVVSRMHDKVLINQGSQPAPAPVDNKK